MHPQPKPDSPAEIEIGLAIIEQMMAPVLFWQFFAVSVFDPTTIETSVLCSVVPGPSETWGAQDMVGYFDPDLRPLLTAKLIRMVKANIWNTYCELVPDELPVGNGLVWQRLTAPEFPFYTGELDYRGGVFHDNPQITHLNAVSAGGDALLVYSRCTEAPSETGPAAVPHYTYVQASGTDWPVVAPDGSGCFEPTLDSERLVVFWPNGLPTGRFVAGDTLQLHGPELGGRWVWAAWFIRIVAPPPPDVAWPAPAGDVGNPFSQAQMDQLNVMLSEWTTHRVTTAILPGMVTEVFDQVNTRADELAAAIAGLGVEPAGGFEDGGTNTLVEANGHYPIPPGAVGFYVFIENAPGATILGESPEAWFDVGFVAQAWGEAWYPSEPIKHNPTVFHPLKPGAESIWFDLSPRTSVSFNWLMPSST